MVKARSELKTNETWDLEQLFESFDAWQNTFNNLLKDQSFFEKIQSFQGRLHESEIELKKLLDLVNDKHREVEKLYVYAHLRLDEDVSSKEHKIAHDKILGYLIQLEAQMSWIQPEILSLDEAVFQKYLTSKALEYYKIYLEKLARLRPYTLSKEEEKLLALSAQPLMTARKSFTILNNVDMKFPKARDSKGDEQEVTHSLYGNYMQSRDRTLRKNAFKSLYSQFETLSNTINEILTGHIQTHVFNMKARGYKSCLEAALHSNDVDPKVYTELIHSAQENLTPLHDFVLLRKELLGLDKVHAYDMYVPCGFDYDYNVSYEKACSIIIEALAPLGSEYQTILKGGLTKKRWVDPFENKNKRSGAYSSGAYDSSPYILMNYQNKLGDLMTLAHEAGHSMHTYYSVKNQPYVYSQYVIFVAEVASTFNEELVFRHLMNLSSSKEEKLFLLQQKIDGIKATFYRQTMFAEFELQMHKLAEAGEPMSISCLQEIYQKLNEKYYGKDFVSDDEIVYEYLRIPHFYSNFYVYQYATGIVAAYALVEDVLAKNDPKNYLNFLASGCTKDPVSLLKGAGVDMATKKPTEIFCQRFGQLIKDFNELRNS